MGDAVIAGQGPLVCVIEDDPLTQRYLAQMLEPEGYRVVAAADGRMGLRVIAEHQPDVVLLDLSMPRMDGLEVCRHLRNDPRTVALPVIVITARAIDDAVAGLYAGADDFLTKPFAQVELLARMRTAFRMRDVVHRMEQAQAIVAALAGAVEAKDEFLQLHCERMAHRASRLAAAVGLREDELQVLAYGALLHDVGKLAMVTEVLTRRGPLSDDERATMRRHPEIGANMVSHLRFGPSLAPIIGGHHERWDGTGYPNGVRGADIPLGARIVSIADAYDAIVSGRPYRPARPVEAAYIELRNGAGTQFDPDLVPMFIDEMDRLAAGIPPSCELPPAALLDRELFPQRPPIASAIAR